MTDHTFSAVDSIRLVARLRPLVTLPLVARPLLRLVAAAGLLYLLFPVAGCGPRAVVEADQPVPVEVRAPRPVREADAVAASGEVEANVSALCAFQLAGRVARVLVDEGQPVRKGQLLAELDAADYKNAFDAAEGQAAAAQAVDRKAAAGLRAQELEQARLDYAQQLDQYQRMKFLFEHKSLPANDFHKIEAAFKASEQRYQMAEQGTRSEDRESATGQAKAAVAQRSEARKRLSDTRLVAPVAGLVGMKKLDVGNTVAAGAPVVSVLDLDPVKVRVGIPEAEIGKVKLGARAVVTIPALDGRVFEGKVEAVGVAADPAARTYTVKIAVPNHDHILRAGMVAEARIESDRQIDALTVPGDAIVRDARGVLLVYVFDAGRRRVYARRVQTGAPLGNEVEIRTGLSAGEQVVVAGQQNVREGSPVTVVGGAR
jgi:membrane fusion protein (multidrug efflux system)